MFQAKPQPRPAQDSISTTQEVASGRAPRTKGFAPSLKGRALRLLAQREHSRLELVQKLAVHAQTAGELAAVLDALEAKDFINPQRVAESVVNRRSARLGASRIRHELLAKGLDADVVAQALEPVKSSELARAHSIWQKKFGNKEKQPGNLDAASRARQMRFLAGRGFAGDVVRQVVQKIPGAPRTPRSEDDNC